MPEGEQVIQFFEADRNPIFVVYGITPRLEDVVAGFRARFDSQAEDLYLSLDMLDAKCDTHEDTIFEIIHQLADRCMSKIADPNDAHALSKSLSSFRKAQREKVSDQPEIQLGRFTGFAEFVVYPLLQNLFRARRCNIIGLERFEEVIEWSPWIYNFILESLLRNSRGVNLRFVLFVRSDNQPSLFHGSDFEGARQKITFQEIADRIQARDDGGYMNYL